MLCGTTAFHRGDPVATGRLEGDHLVCPWHYSCFRVRDGATTCGPADQPLETFRVVIDGEIGWIEQKQ